MGKSAKQLEHSDVQSIEDDQALMLRVKEGDQAAFGQLYERYKGAIVNYVFGLTKNKAVANEIAQEVFLKLYRVRESYEIRAKFTTFLWTLAKNTSIDFLRKKREILYDDRAPSDEEAPMYEAPGDFPTAEEELIEACEKQMIQDCMDRLPVKQKEAMGLRIHAELSYDEIAQSMQTSESAVKSLIKRGKDSLVACVKKKMQGN